MSKEVARIRRSKKLRANLQKNGVIRVSISKSLKNITAQLIDSANGMVLATISTQQKAFSKISGGNIEAAKKIGSEVAKKALDLGHKKVTFDRSGYKYHGRVKALADGARDGGLEF
tara:strand:- start:948 stop:1295 length:348 start_codon:yes stop_codon:yes gene_type:complete